ncbi:hypothetical protein CGZ93_11200 [Enemella dayhoffiae]|uniref:Acyl-CoA carboxylase subunit epsilon n=1 Tax=Enemella dayhoffiae TaxID=2016507 RepID=A0A255H2W6_9ACTN|nr:acyl-CoA carboxylase subunit epsilon [Enemella dayhoffiae]OYO21024.1 hypothetical protein CGZ93_11200 [Enemella dayhoffiae]
MSEADSPATPTFEVVSGSPSAEELAAIVTVLSAASAANGDSTPPSDRPRAGGWKSYWRTVRREHRPGPGAWGGH